MQSDIELALDSLDLCWRKAGDAMTVAEARMRLMQYKAKALAPELAEEPEWLTKEFAGITAAIREENGDEFFLSPAIQTCAKKLILAVMKLAPNFVLELGPGYSQNSMKVELENDTSRVSWLVSESPIGWPMCNVRVYVPDDVHPFRLKIRSTMLVTNVVKWSSAALLGQPDVSS